MLNLIKLYVASLYLIKVVITTGKSVPIRKESIATIFLEITPSDTNLLDTYSFGKEYKVSLEFQANTVGDKWYNILEIGARPGVMGAWLDTNSKVFLASKVSGSEQQIRTGAISTGTWYKLEVTQSLLVDKVSI